MSFMGFRVRGVLAQQRQTIWGTHLQEALAAAGEDYVAMVTLNNKAPVSI